eukprot:6214364-Pleurochrysis_carterae.AAC.5
MTLKCPVRDGPSMPIDINRQKTKLQGSRVSESETKSSTLLITHQSLQLSSITKCICVDGRQQNLFVRKLRTVSKREFKLHAADEQQQVHAHELWDQAHNTQVFENVAPLAST